MGYQLPVLKKCCFCFPRRSGLLAYGYLKLVIAIILEAIYISILFKFGSAASILGISIATVIIDSIAVIIFIIGCHKRNYLCIKWYYTYSIYILVLKIIMMVIMVFFRPITLLPNIPSILVHAYLLLLIRSEVMELNQNSNVQCEFENKMAQPGCTITIEVEDNGIPEKGVEVVNVVNGAENNYIHGDVQKSYGTQTSHVHGNQVLENKEPMPGVTKPKAED